MRNDAPAPDFDALFKSAPGIFMVLRPDFTIVAANDACLEAAMVERGAILGKDVFEAFPENPDDPAAAGQASLRASLEKVLRTRAADRMPITRYDLRRPAERGGGFEERFWNPSNYPVLDDEGRVAYIVHQTEDVTELARLRRSNVEREAELSRAIAMYQAVYDQGLFAGRLDLDGTVMDANRACLEQCGYTRDQVIGKKFWDCG